MGRWEIGFVIHLAVSIVESTTEKTSKPASPLSEGSAPRDEIPTGGKRIFVNSGCYCHYRPSYLNHSADGSQKFLTGDR